MSRLRPRGYHGDEPGLILGAIAALVLVPAILVWIPIVLSKPDGYRGGGPIAAVAALWNGDVAWTPACTWYALGEAAILAAAGVLLWLARRFGKKRASRVDWAARRMATRGDLARLAPAGVADSARRLRPGLPGRAPPDEHGVPIGVTVHGGIQLRQSWEDMACDIWGPRTGKTTARAIPAIVAAPGPVVVTSVKGDIVDATFDVRAQRGRCWLFDPMHLLQRDAGKKGRPGMWWNPLRGIDTITKARILAEHFSFAEQTNESMSPRDPFFDTAASDLIACLILAAAVSGKTMVEVYRWTTNQRETEPGDILRAHGHHLAADSVYGVLAMPDRTRGSVYAIASASLSVLTEPLVTEWITPRSPSVPELRLDRFVRSTDTLYLVSRGGPGSPAPLIAALADAVMRGGETAARMAPGRRLDPPLLTVADEAANIVRIKQLPNLFSFYGSHGLPIMVVLQSYAQGEIVWGKAGMRQMWDASNIRTYGGGVADPHFLEELSRSIGHDWQMVTSVTTQSRSWDRSTSRTPHRLRLLDVEDLAALPLGRMIVLASGAPAVLVRTQPWQHGPYATQIRASLARWDPRGDYDPALHPTAEPSR